MKNLLITATTIFLLTACGGSAPQTEEAPEAPPVTENQADTPSTPASEPDTSLAGLYVVESADESWAVLVEKTEEGWSAKAVEAEGMLPSPDEIFTESGDLDVIRFERFEANTDRNTFDSDWGKGKFELKNNKMVMTFEEKEGLFHPETAQTDPELSLDKVSRR